LQLHFHPKSDCHREETAKLTATLINGAAVACLVGATFGPWLNPALDWGWNSPVLFAIATLIHMCAQFVLSLGFRRD
jgi:predicted MFS family arabinose efflux permease